MKILNLTILFLSLLQISCASTANANNCWQNEVDPLTKKPFQTEYDYNNFKKNWDKQKPTTPNPFLLLKAFATYKSEQQTADSFKNDKAAHCYIGCRIAQDTNYECADYAGWKKESDDLTDCKLQSYFEEEDYLATIAGAESGLENPEKNHCREFCHPN